MTTHPQRRPSAIVPPARRQPRVGLYLRSARPSTDAIRRQEHLAWEHAQRQGWSVVQVFVDNGISGCLAAGFRPGLRALVEVAQTGALDVVVAADWDRYTRSPLDLSRLLDWAEEQGVLLEVAR